MKMRMLLLLLVAALCTATGADAEEKKPEPTVYRLKQQAKAVSAKVFGAATIGMHVDEHDLVVEFRVANGDKRVRESLKRFIDLVSEHGEREKCALLGMDMRAACDLTAGVPLPPRDPRKKTLTINVAGEKK